MAVDPDFLEFSKELFEGLGPIRTGRMFGGAGLYLDDAMFAMIVSDQIFMKADKELAAQYAEAGSVPFEYDTKTGTRKIPGLMSLPENALDDPEEALEWAKRSMIPAEAAAAEKRRKKKS